MAEEKDTGDEHIDMSDDAPEETTEQQKHAEDKTDTGKQQPKAKRLHHTAWQWLLAHKIVSIVAAVGVVLITLAAVPFTRYLLAGTVVRQNFTVAVTDSQTHKPVTSASVTLGGKTVQTDSQGVAKIRAHVGTATVAISKKYYRDASLSVLVPFKQKQPYEVALTATGRQVPVTVVNTISGQPAADITISALNSQAITDSKGEAIVVLPADKTEVQGSVSGKGFNKASITVKVTASLEAANKFTITPAGKLYFLSNATGKLDVVKSDLDGKNRQVVLAGTGNEDKPNTVLLASRDWKYIALLSKRDGGEHAKLFLIETDSDKLTTMDEGTADFSPIGWSGDRFIYTLTRSNIEYWQPKHQALKSYSASAKSITVLDQTTAEGPNSFDFRSEYFSDTYILDKEVAFIKNWNSNGSSAVKATFNTIQSDGSQKKVVKAYDDPYLQSRSGDFNEIYIRYSVGSTSQHDSYENGKLSAATLSDDQYYNGDYARYIVSPSGNKTLWTEFRDGKNVFLIGDAKGQNGKELGISSEDFSAYGWFTDDYVLLTKKGSEMRITPAGRSATDIEATLKVSDYYKPNYNLRGYGYGYGG